MIRRLFIYFFLAVGTIHPSLSSKLEKQLGMSLEEAYKPSIVKPEQIFHDDIFQSNLKNVNHGKPEIQKSARSSLRQMALAGHLESMVEMGKLCMQQPKKFNARYFCALRWFVLAYQVEYLRLGKAGPVGLGAITHLRGDPLALKDPDCKLFFGSLKFFLEGHEARTAKMIGSFIKLELAYTQPDPKNGLEPYLSLKDQAIKAEWFWQCWLSYVATQEGLREEAESRVYFKERMKAYECFCKEGSPHSLNMAGTLLHEGLERDEADRKPDYYKAAELYRKSGEPNASFHLGLLYHDMKISAEGSTSPYEEAAYWYERSQIPEALCNLGNLYRLKRIGNGQSPENYEKARDCYLKSGHPNALWKLGTLHRDGLLGEINYERAAYYFRLAHEKQEHGESLTELGLLYMNGQVGMNDGQPDYEKAKELFLRSGRREAYGNLLYLLLHLKLDTVDGDVNYPLAFEYAFRSGFPNSCERMLDLVRGAWIEISDVASNLMGWSTQDEAYAGVISLLEKNLNDPQPNYIRALRAYFLEQDCELAKTLFMTAHAAGYEEARYYYKMAVRRLELQRLEREEQDAVPDIPEIELSVSKCSDEHVMQESVIEDLEVSVDRPSIRPKQYKPARVKMSRAERIKHIQEKLSMKVGSSVGQIRVALDDERPREEGARLSIKFVSEKVRQQFERVSNTSKLTELLSDMEVKPHGVEGAGKPEVLKGKYKGLKGCISRRLDKESRIVYKVTAQREITVVSVEGHYE